MKAQLNAESNASLCERRVTHADLQKAIPGLRAETLSKMVKLAKQKRSHLMKVYGSNFYEAITLKPFPKTIRSADITIREAKPTDPEGRSTDRPFISPSLPNESASCDLKSCEPAHSNQLLQ